MIKMGFLKDKLFRLDLFSDREIRALTDRKVSKSPDSTSLTPSIQHTRQKEDPSQTRCYNCILLKIVTIRKNLILPQVSLHITFTDTPKPFSNDPNL